MVFDAVIKIILTITIYGGHITHISTDSTTLSNSFMYDRCGPCSSCPVLLAKHLLHCNHCLGHLLPVQLLHHCKYYSVLT